MPMLPVVQGDVANNPLRMRDLDQPRYELFDPILPIDPGLLSFKEHLLQWSNVPGNLAFKKVCPAYFVLPKSNGFHLRGESKFSSGWCKGRQLLKAASPSRQEIFW